MLRIMNDKLKVNEIFDSIEGEGKRAGELATFIRLTGCNLRCSYCDTAYAFSEGTELQVSDIMDNVNYRNVTLTGGEPLIQPIEPLLTALGSHYVNIETNGSIFIKPYFDYTNIFFTMDYKCSSSNEQSKMFLDNLNILRKQDVLKFVVGSTQDLQEAKGICKKYRPKAKIYVSPVFDRIEPADIVKFMKEFNLQNWKLQLQLHKFVWNPKKRGV